MKAATPPQIGQRVRVGVIGLVAVVLLIALASAILGSVTREQTIATAGGAKPDTVANMALENGVADAEPLADMGISPVPENRTAAK